MLCEESWHRKVYRGTSIEKERQLRIESGLIQDISKNCFRGGGRDMGYHIYKKYFHIDV